MCAPERRAFPKCSPKWIKLNNGFLVWTWKMIIRGCSNMLTGYVTAQPSSRTSVGPNPLYGQPSNVSAASDIVQLLSRFDWNYCPPGEQVAGSNHRGVFSSVKNKVNTMVEIRKWSLIGLLSLSLFHSTFMHLAHSLFPLSVLLM